MLTEENQAAIAIAMDESGRIEIPQAVREQLGLTPHQLLQLEISHGRIILSQPPQLRREGTALVVETPPLGTSDEIRQWMEDLREERIQAQMNL